MNDAATPPRTPQENLETCGQLLMDMVLTRIELLRQASPEAQPTGVLADVFRLVGDAMGEIVPPVVVRTAMLVAFEGSHPQPMNFIDINKVRKSLETISAARKEVERVTPGGVILPGGVDGPEA